MKLLGGLAGIGCALLLTAACGSDSQPAGPYTPPPAPVVKFFLVGSSEGADLTYSVGGGGVEQRQGVAVPLSEKGASTQGLTVDAAAGDRLYFSAQNTGDGSLTCSISVDGDVVVTKTSEGEFAIVTCQATA